MNRVNIGGYSRISMREAENFLNRGKLSVFADVSFHPLMHLECFRISITVIQIIVRSVTL